MSYVTSAPIFSQPSDDFADHSSYPTSLVSIIESSNSGEGVIHCRGERLVEGISTWSTIAPFTERLLRLSGIGQLRQQVTIGTLPDDVLLKVFKFFVDATYVGYFVSEKWRTLVHVCRRWRIVAFASPRHLNLKLLCGPRKRSAKKAQDIWPELPIYIHDRNSGYPMKETRDNVAAALRLNHRVAEIRLEHISDSEWKTLVPLMQHPFPILTDLWLALYNKNPISCSFLGGSAPSLRDLFLEGVSFPALPELLLSTTNLVCLSYTLIPRSGYISTRAMVTSLSALTRLESLSITFMSRQSLPDRTIRIPPHTRTLLPALTYLEYDGGPEYVRDLVAQIDAPLLESMEITLSHLDFPEVSELAKFVHRADKLSLLSRTKVNYQPNCISLSLSPERLVRIVDNKTLLLNIRCHKSALRLSCLAQFCASSLPTLSLFESLHIHVSINVIWKDAMEDSDNEWLKLLRLFNNAKDLHLCNAVAPHVSQALRELQVERVMEVLPALENIFILGLKPSGPVKEAISEFADARRLAGHPVSICDWKGGMYSVRG